MPEARGRTKPEGPPCPCDGGRASRVCSARRRPRLVGKWRGLGCAAHTNAQGRPCHGLVGLPGCAGVLQGAGRPCQPDQAGAHARPDGHVQAKFGGICHKIQVSLTGAGSFWVGAGGWSSQAWPPASELCTGQGALWAPHFVHGGSLWWFSDACRPGPWRFQAGRTPASSSLSPHLRFGTGQTSGRTPSFEPSSTPCASALAWTPWLPTRASGTGFWGLVVR